MSAEYRDSPPVIITVAGCDETDDANPCAPSAVLDPLLGMAALNPQSRERIRRAQRLIYLNGPKRLLDIVAAVTLLALMSPVMAVVVVAILIDSGRPVLFVQTRIGKDGKLFGLLKFRTMIPDRRTTTIPTTFPDRRVRHKSASDPRVTRIGAFLRRTSLDEVPQLINVLRGEMSMVGPRPELPALVDTYEDWQHARHLVRPGITGWWQVNGRSDLPMHHSTDLDIYYLEHMSFWLDVQIALRTPVSVVKGHGAY